MNVEEIVSIYKNGGSTIYRIGSYYFSRQVGFNYSFPALIEIPICEIPLNSLKWKYLISIILTNSRIKNTYEFILHTNDYNLDKFERRTRNRIRKSLHNCFFRRPTLEDLLFFGLKINQETLKRQHRNDKVLSNSKYWERYIKSLYCCDKITILGAYYAERMVGYIIAFKLEEKFIIQHAFIDKNDSEQTAPMNGLIFTMVNQLIEENGFLTISYGLDSIKDLPDLNRFKMNMLFEKTPATRVFIINPFLLPFIKVILFILFHLLKHNKTRNNFIRELIHIYNGHRLLYKEFKKIVKEQKKNN